MQYARMILATVIVFSVVLPGSPVVGKSDSAAQSTTVARLPEKGDAHDVSFPDSIAGRRAAAFFAAFKAGQDAMRGFEAENRAKSALERRSIEDRIKQYRELRSRWDTLTLGELTTADELHVTVIAYAAGLDEWLEFRFELEEEAPHGLIAIYIKGPMPPPGGEDSPLPVLDTKSRSEVVDEIAKVLDEAYVYPEVGKKMAQTVRKNLKAEEYDDISLAHRFSRRLTDDLRDICHDRHLRVEAGRFPKDAPDRADDKAWWAKTRWRNFGFEKVERLPGNVGYLKFNQFSALEGAKETAGAAMNFLANTDALIFDLRENGGGSPEMIAFLSSYIFDKPTHLNSFYNRREDKHTETWTQADVPGSRFGQEKPVYVLTSAFTFSGAEEFTYNLKNLKRGTIVGETTGGGAHPVFMHRVNDTFSITVPYARAINPITKTNWEGVGVKPDIDVPADRALTVAQREALQKLIETGTNGERTKALRAALRRIEAQLAVKEPKDATTDDS